MQALAHGHRGRQGRGQGGGLGTSRGVGVSSLPGPGEWAVWTRSLGCESRAGLLPPAPHPASHAVLSCREDPARACAPGLHGGLLGQAAGATEPATQ